MSNSTSTWPAEGSLFRLPNYPAWFGADTFLLAGSAVHWIVVSLMAYELSGSVTVAGWFFTARGVASLVTQVLGGTFIDRHDHRTLILVQAGCCGVLWLTMGMLFVMGRLTFTLFAVFCLSSSLVFGFLNGTTNAALINVVGPERYAQAESLNQGRDAAVNTAGSPLGAALYSLVHAGPFFASAVCDGIAFVCALFLHLPPQEKVEQADKSRSFVSDLLSGWKWVFSSRTILVAVAVIGLASFGDHAIYQAVNLTLVSNGTEALLISLVNVAGGIATMAGSVVSARLCDRVPAGWGVAVTLALIGAANIPLLVSSSYPAILLTEILVAIPSPLLNALLQGFMFSKTPPDLQGRARAALTTMIMIVAVPTGGIAGTLLPVMGFAPFVAVMAVFVLAAAVIAFVHPRIRTLPASPDWPSVEL